MELQSNAKSLVVRHLFSTQPEKCIKKKRSKKQKTKDNTCLQVVQTNKNVSAYYTEKRRQNYITLNRMKCAHFIRTK